MILNLQEYNFQLYYTFGKKNVVADALSKAPFAGEPLLNREEKKGSINNILPKEKNQKKKWFEILDKMDSPTDIPFLELAKMQTIDASIQRSIDKDIERDKQHLWVIKDECL